MRKKESVENGFIRYWTKEGILHSQFKSPTIVTLDKAREMITLRHEISIKEKQYWCCDITNVKSFTKEGRDYADIHGQDYLHATAAIVDSHLTMFIFNVFLKIKKVNMPFQAFKKLDKAVEWLKEVKRKQEHAKKG